MVESSSLPSHMWLVLLRLSITLLIDFAALFDDLSLTRDKKFENKKKVVKSLLILIDILSSAVNKNAK